MERGATGCASVTAIYRAQPVLARNPKPKGKEGRRTRGLRRAIPAQMGRFPEMAVSRRFERAGARLSISPMTQRPGHTTYRANRVKASASHRSNYGEKGSPHSIVSYPAARRGMAGRRTAHADRMYAVPIRRPGRACGRQVPKLYGAGAYFPCCHCYQRAYAAQRENPNDRALHRAQHPLRSMASRNAG
jgi:hypothetical protein